MLKNGFYNLLGAVVRTGITLLTIPLTIRILGVEEYGLWTLVSTVIAVVTLAEAGLSVSTTVFLARDLANHDRKAVSETLTVSFTAMLILATMAATILWFSSSTVIHFFPRLEANQETVAIQAMELGGLVVWSKLLQRVFVGVEQAYQKYGLMNLLNTVQTGLTSLGTVAIAYGGGKTLALMQWQVVTNMGLLLAHGIAGWQILRLSHLELIWNQYKGYQLLHYSLMSWFTSIGSALFSQGDRLIVGSLLGTKLLGVYAAITTVTAQINALSALGVQPLLPELSRLLKQSDTKSERLWHTVKQGLQMNASIAVAIGGGLFAFAPWVIQVTLPNVSQAEILPLFYISIAIYTLYSINAVGYYLLFSQDAVLTCLTITLTTGIVTLIAIALGAKTLGLMGAIVGNTLYLGIWWLTLQGMKNLQIPAKIWTRWIGFLIFWFGSVISVNILISQHLILRTILFLLQGSVLLSWLMRTYPYNLKVANLFLRK
jgi:O-antigen/teichoic acid export membrane protein